MKRKSLVGAAVVALGGPVHGHHSDAALDIETILTVEGTVTGMQGKKCSNTAALLDKVGEELEHRHTADYDQSEPVSVGGTTTQQTIGSGRW